MWPYRARSTRSPDEVLRSTRQRALSAKAAGVMGVWRLNQDHSLHWSGLNIGQCTLGAKFPLLEKRELEIRRKKTFRRFCSRCLQRVVENTCFSYRVFFWTQLTGWQGARRSSCLVGGRIQQAVAYREAAAEPAEHGSAARSRGRSRPPRRHSLRVRRARSHNPYKLETPARRRTGDDEERERERGHDD